MTGGNAGCSIIESLIKGSITVNRKEEYKKLLEDYPDSPHLNWLFGDFLKNKHYYVDAMNKYRKAYNLFMAEGEVLYAITTLLELWEVVNPTAHDFRVLHSHLRRRKSYSSMIAESIARMSYKELRATLPCLKKIKVKADEIVQEPGDPEEAIYFVVCGELVKSPAETESGRYAVVEYLKANDHFGDDFPCEVKRPATYQVRAVSDAELLRITKKDFLALTTEFPDLKSGITKLIRYQIIPEDKKPEKFFRKTSRRHYSIFLTLEILDNQPGRHPLTVKGFSLDISLGGACVIVDPRYRDIPAQDIMHRKTKLRISLPDESVSVEIMGHVAWCKETDFDGEETYALGVQFNEMPQRLRGSMIIFINAVGTTNKHLNEFNLSQDKIESRRK